jgi:hypothetical protein
LAALLCMAWALAAWVNAVWWSAAAAGDRGPVFGAAACALSGVCLLLGWRRQPAGHLLWDGQAWAWHGAGDRSPTVLSAAEPVLDLQALMLLRLRSSAGARSLLWVDAAAHSAHWLDLRRALHARPPNAGAATRAAGRDGGP